MLFGRLLLRAILIFFPPLALFLASGALGGVEEFTKFLALIWLSWSGKNPFRGKLLPAKVWPQSKKGLMLAGFSVGVGYMVLGNAFHLRKLGFALSKVDDVFSLSDNQINTICFALWKFLWFLIVLNPNPYLTGIAAGRFAKTASDASKGQRLTADILLNVLWPSALLHILYNQANGPWVQFFCCLMIFRVFLDTWNTLDEPADSKSEQEV